MRSRNSLQEHRFSTNGCFASTAAFLDLPKSVSFTAASRQFAG
jgi:hypothetical protein